MGYATAEILKISVRIVTFDF